MSLLKSLFKTVVVNTMQSGFRRAGVRLDKGTNELELDEKQLVLFNRDPNLKVDVLDVIKDSIVDSAINSVTALVAQKTGVAPGTVQMVIEAFEMVKGNPAAKEAFVEGVKEAAIGTVASTVVESVIDKGSDMLESVVCQLDMSSAAEELHPFIAVIDELSAEAKLESKPTVNDLAVIVEVDGNDKKVKPTAEQRDQAWDWYQANVEVVNVDDAINQQSEE